MSKFSSSSSSSSSSSQQQQQQQTPVENLGLEEMEAMYFQQPDSILDPHILRHLRTYIKKGGKPATVVENLSASYRGYPQMINLMCSWMELRHRVYYYYYIFLLLQVVLMMMMMMTMTTVFTLTTTVCAILIYIYMIHQVCRVHNTRDRRLGCAVPQIDHHPQFRPAQGR